MRRPEQPETGRRQAGGRRGPAREASRRVGANAGRGAAGLRKAESERSNSYLSPKLQARGFPHKGGMGVFARKPVAKGEVLVVWGGVIRNYQQLQALPEDLRRHSIQVEEGLYQVPASAYDPPDFVNHSCNPNAGMSGQIALVAMRNIGRGEEICMDYAMCDATPYDEFDCHCGESTCRGQVIGSDWARPELWKRYDGYFSPYLQRRIEAIRAEQNAVRVPVKQSRKRRGAGS